MVFGTPSNRCLASRRLERRPDEPAIPHRECRNRQRGIRSRGRARSGSILGRTAPAVVGVLVILGERLCRIIRLRADLLGLVPQVAGRCGAEEWCRIGDRLQKSRRTWRRSGTSREAPADKVLEKTVSLAPFTGGNGAKRLEPELVRASLGHGNPHRRV